MSNEPLKYGNSMRDEMITILEEMGLLKKETGSKAVIKVLLTTISLLLALLITVVYVGIETITENQRQEIAQNTQNVNEIKGVLKELQYAIRDHERRLNKAGY